MVLWELFTYGQGALSLHRLLTSLSLLTAYPSPPLAGHTPYPEVQLGPTYEPFIAYLKEGNRMAQPESCPPNL